MSTTFEWVPFFEQMARKLISYRGRQRELIQMLDDAGVNGLNDQFPKGKLISITEIDPFTFMSMVSKHSWNRRSKIFESLRTKLKIQAKTPQDFSGIPSVDARQARFFPYKYERDREDIDQLWNLYSEVVIDGVVSDTTLARAMSIKYAGKAKLTQAMFCAAPKTFLPIDSQTIPYLERLGHPHNFKSATEYGQICRLVKARNEPLYAFSYNAWLSNQTRTEAQFQKSVLTNNNKKLYKEPKGPIRKPLPQEHPGALPIRFQRRQEVSYAALKNAKFRCEINESHTTFLSQAKGVRYVEAHHLIPFSRHDEFDAWVDVLANIVALCPNCHRLLHHGRLSDKRVHLRNLFTRRQEMLAEKGLVLPDGERSLLTFYSAELTGDED